MKIVLCIAAAAVVLGGYAQEQKKFVEPNPYGTYGPAMKPVEGLPRAIEWHLTDRAAIDAATSPDALAGILADECKVKSLLAEVKPGYGTDALAAARIGAVSQYVMEGAGTPWWKFWSCSRTSERKLWTKSLLAAVAAAEDDYVAIFLLDQLRWCAFPCQADCVLASTDKTRSVAVKEMARTVAGQIRGCDAD